MNAPTCCGAGAAGSASPQPSTDHLPPPHAPTQPQSTAPGVPAALGGSSGAQAGVDAAGGVGAGGGATGREPLTGAASQEPPSMGAPGTHFLSDEEDA